MPQECLVLWALATTDATSRAAIPYEVVCNSIAAATVLASPELSIAGTDESAHYKQFLIYEFPKKSWAVPPVFEELLHMFSMDFMFYTDQAQIYSARQTSWKQ